MYVFLYANQTLLESVEAGGVEHFLFDPGSVWTPGHEEELFLFGLLRGALALVVVLEVEETVAAVLGAAARQVTQEHVVSLLAISWKK